jgi:hypothetical protein
MRWAVLILAVALWLIVDGGVNHWRYTNAALYQVRSFSHALAIRLR